MLVGGINSDIAWSVAVHPRTGEIFFGGSTTSTAGWLTPGYNNDLTTWGGFLARTRPSGEVMWTKLIQYTTTASVYAIDLYTPSNVPESEHFVAACGVSPGALNSTYLAAGITSAGSQTPFLRRYFLNGTLQWETGFPTTGGVGRCMGVRTLTNGSTVVLLQQSTTGLFKGVSTTPSGGGQVLSMFLLDNAGALVWFNGYVGFSGGTTGGLAVDDTGDLATSSIYATSYSSFTFGGQATLGGEDIVVWRVAADTGVAVWHTRAGGSSHERGFSLTLSADKSFLYVVADTRSKDFQFPVGTVLNTPNSYDTVVLRFLASNGSSLSAFVIPSGGSTSTTTPAAGISLDQPRAICMWRDSAMPPSWGTLWTADTMGRHHRVAWLHLTVLLLSLQSLPCFCSQPVLLSPFPPVLPSRHVAGAGESRSFEAYPKPNPRHPGRPTSRCPSATRRVSILKAEC
jgi:hypothetical protein